MANKRMFSMTIIDSDSFLEMPLSTQALYFHLCMRADDDGFVNNAKRIQRMVNCSEDDLKVLIAKRFIIPFESGVVVIKHWKIHNYIQSDRYHPTTYTEEKAMLGMKDNKAYTLDTGCIQGCIQDGSNVYSQNSIDKNRLGKSREVKHIRNQIPPTIEMVSEYIQANGYNVDAEAFMDYYESKGWMVGRNKMKDWQASVRNWSRRDDDRRSNGERSSVRTGSGASTATNADSDTTVWKRFKTMEDVLQENS
jgi:hypothetical protein